MESMHHAMSDMAPAHQRPGLSHIWPDTKPPDARTMRQYLNTVTIYYKFVGFEPSVSARNDY